MMFEQTDVLAMEHGDGMVPLLRADNGLIYIEASTHFDMVKSEPFVVVIATRDMFGDEMVHLPWHVLDAIYQAASKRRAEYLK